MNANEYQGFNVYIDNSLVDSIFVYEASKSFSRTFTLSNYTISEGWHNFKVKASTLGGEFPIGNDDGVQFYYNPNIVKPFTDAKIISIDIASSSQSQITIEVNGYGSVTMRSITHQQVRYNDGYLGTTYIEKDDYELKRDGKVRKTISVRKDVDLSIPYSLPLGTIEVAFRSDSYAETLYYLSVGTYYFRDYKDKYRTTILPNYGSSGLIGFNTAVAQISTVKDDWTVLVNLFFYLHSTAYKKLMPELFSKYTPKSGDIITADMYNELIRTAIDCAHKIGIYGGEPNFVNSGDIIPSTFIRTLGDIANRCVNKQMELNNDVIDR